MMRNTFRQRVSGAILAIALLSPAGGAHDLPAEDVARLLRVGGDNWKPTAEGFHPLAPPGEDEKAMFVWPAEDLRGKVITTNDGKGFMRIKMRWQLRPGARFPEQSSDKLIYRWALTATDVGSFQLVEIDRTASAGHFSITLRFSQKQMQSLKQRGNVLFGMFENSTESRPLADYLSLRVSAAE